MCYIGKYSSNGRSGKFDRMPSLSLESIELVLDSDAPSPGSGLHSARETSPSGDLNSTQRSSNGANSAKRRYLKSFLSSFQKHEYLYVQQFRGTHPRRSFSFISFA